MPVFPIVAVEVPSDLPAHLAAATVRACDSALGVGQCTLHTRLSKDADPAWVATVVTDPTLHGQVRVDLRRALRAPAQIRWTRTLSFETTEQDVHRWSTVGVVVAALVVSGSQSTNSPLPTETQPDADSTPASPEPESHRVPARAAVTAPHQPKTNQTRSRSSAPIRLALAATVGDSPEQGAPMRIGAVLRPSLLLSDWVSLWVAIAGARSRDEVVAFVWSGAAGVGFAASAPGSRIGVEGRVGIRGDQVLFQALEGARSDDDSRLRWGPSVGIDVNFPLASAIDLLVLCEGAVLWPRVLVNLHDHRVGQLGHLEGMAGLGLRAWFGGD